METIAIKPQSSQCWELSTDVAHLRPRLEQIAAQIKFDDVGRNATDVIVIALIGGSVGSLHSDELAVKHNDAQFLELGLLPSNLFEANLFHCLSADTNPFFRT